MSAMPPSQHAPVVVGVDDSSGSEAALAYAVAECRRGNAPLHLVHVVADVVPYAPSVAFAQTEIAERGGNLLRTTQERAQALGATAVTGAVVSGGRGHRLSQVAADGELLVVGRDAREGLERLLRANTATSVAARARGPVVVVPPAWSPQVARGWVVLGVKSPVAVAEILDQAFAMAAAIGSGLRLLHAWQLPGAYADIIESRVSAEEWRQRSVAELEEVVGAWREKYPDVKVDLMVVHGVAAQVLIDASRDADEVVITRRWLGAPAALHLGATARALLAHAACPVRVISPQRTSTATAAKVGVTA